MNLPRPSSLPRHQSPLLFLNSRLLLSLHLPYPFRALLLLPVSSQLPNVPRSTRTCRGLRMSLRLSACGTRVCRRAPRELPVHVLRLSCVRAPRALPRLFPMDSPRPPPHNRSKPCRAATTCNAVAELFCLFLSNGDQRTQVMLLYVSRVPRPSIHTKFPVQRRAIRTNDASFVHAGRVTAAKDRDRPI